MPFYRSFQVNEPPKPAAPQKTATPLNTQAVPVQNIVPEQSGNPPESRIQPLNTQQENQVQTPAETQRQLLPENQMQGAPQPAAPENRTQGMPQPVTPENRTQAEPLPAVPENRTPATPLPAAPENRTPAGTPELPPSNNGTPLQPQTPETPEPVTPRYPADMSTAAFGGLRVSVGNIRDNLPITGASIQISETNGDTTTLIDEISTASTGQTDVIELPAPPLAYSEESGSPRPYSEYNLTIRADGFEPVQIVGTEVLPDVVALQNVQMLPMLQPEPQTAETFVIPDHTLYGIYPPKIVEDEVKEMAGSGEIVLSSVVIPEFIVVHDGTPTNTSAQNYYVRYRDYIKNVASSEIYATWPESTIYANILAIQSFTLNRVYTEWYRNRGYNFTITSSTAYDHKWIPERNIFDTINTAVDNVFNNFLSRPNVRQPILTQYCDGKRVTCPGLMSQWGSKYLGDDGYDAIQILRNYYGASIYINTTEEISGVPSSFPGEALTEGSRGEAVRQMQEQLNAIADVYYVVPNIAADGIFGPRTEEAVRAFQRQFDLTPNGIVDFTTWYKISEIYVAITRIAEYTR